MTTERPLTPTWLRLTLVVALGLLVTVVVWWPMIKAYPNTAIEDGRYFHHQIEVSKAAVRRYHELPLWNAFDCRGLPMWDHPENITASPIFWLTLPFPAAVTLIVWNVVHVVIGFLGMWLLARDDLKTSRAAAFIAASAFAFGTVHNQYAGEHEAFISFYSVPLLFYLWRRAERSWALAVGTGVFLASMVYDGATYALPMAVVLLGLETVMRCTSVRRALDLGARAAVVGVFAFLLGAARILPLVDQFATHDRVMEADFDHLMNWATWKDMYLLRSPEWRARVPDQQYVFGEYQAYIGWLGLLMLILGFATTAAETWWLVLLSVAMIVFMLGHFAPKAPWTLLHAHVPLFKAMRVPSRFRLILAMPIALWMGLAADRVPQLFSRYLGKVALAKAARVALVCVGVFAAADSAGLFTQILEYRFAGPAPAKVTPSERFYYGGADLSHDFINHPLQNHAYLGCRAGWAYNAGAALWTGDLPQARALDEGATVEVANRTHNTFTLDVDVKQPSTIVLNTGYDRGWRSNVGAPVERARQLALELPPGRHRVFVRYWPRTLTLGLWLSGFGVVATAAFFLRRRIAEAIRARRKG